MTFKVNALDGSQLLVEDAPPRNLALWTWGGTRWNLFGTMMLPVEVSPGEVQANGLTWAFGRGAYLTFTDACISKDASGSAGECPSDDPPDEGIPPVGPGNPDYGKGPDVTFEPPPPRDSAPPDDAVQQAQEAYDEACADYDEAQAEVEAARDALVEAAAENEARWEEFEAAKGAADEAASGLSVLGGANEWVTETREQTVQEALSPLGTGPGGQLQDPRRYPARAADPVALFSGAYQRRDTDLMIPSIGVAFEVTRVYSNQIYCLGSFGPKWDVWFDARVRRLASGRVYLWTGDGLGLILSAGGGGWTAPGLHATLTTDGASWRLTDPFGNVRVFHHETGLVMRMEDRFHNGIDVARDAKGVPSGLVDGLGRRLTFVTEVAGELARIRSITDWTGRVWSYDYGGTGALASVTGPGEAGHGYGYQDGADARERCNLVSVGGSGAALTNVYGSDPLSRNRVISQDFGGDVYQLAYEKLGAPSADAPGASSRTTVTRGGVQTIYDFDGKGELLSETTGGAVSKHAYDGDGNAVQTTFPNGQILRRTFDANGNLTSVTQVSTDPATAGDDVTSMSYGAFAQLASISTGGVTITHALNGLGLPTSVSLPTATLLDGTRQELSASYQYDAQGRLTSFTDPAGNVRGYGYGGSGLLESVTVNGKVVTTFERDELGRAKTSTSADGKVSTYTFDALDRLRAIQTPGAGEVRYDYDANGRLVSQRERSDGGGGDSGWAETGVSYDGKGRLTGMSWGLDGAESGAIAIGYDDRDQVTQVTWPDGSVDRYSDPDERGVYRTVQIGATGAMRSLGENGAAVAETDSRGNTTTIRRDGLGRELAITDPLGTVTTYARDAAGRITRTTVTDPGGTVRSEVACVYDEVGRPQRLRVHALGPGGADEGWLEQGALLDPLGRVTKLVGPGLGSKGWSYDADGNLLASTDEVGNQAVWTRDEQGRPIGLTQTLVDGSTTPPTQRILRHTFGWDDAGRLAFIEDDLGNRVSYEYHADGSLAAVVNPDGTREELGGDAAGRSQDHTVAWTDGSGAPRGTLSEHVEYDAQGRPTMITNARGAPFRVGYDEHGNPASVVLPDGTELYSFTWDAGGNLLSARDARGVQATFGYDELSRPRRMDLTLPPGVEGPTFEEWEYDAAGNVTVARNGAHTIEVAYDSLGRVRSETVDGRSVGYAWRNDGTLESITYPSGLVLGYGFDPAGRPAAVRVDAPGASFPGPAGIAGAPLCTFGIAGPATPAGMSFLNGVRSRTRHDAAGRPLSLEVLDPSGAPIERVDSLRDAAGRVILRRREGVAAMSVTHESPGWIAAVAEGDPGARPDLAPFEPGGGGTQADLAALARSLDPGAAATRSAIYQHDAAGNRVSVTRAEGGVTTVIPYVADVADRYLSVGGVAITYDAVGNVTSDGTFGYGYDHANRLVSIRAAGSATPLVEISYDPLGRPTVIREGGAQRACSYDGAQLIEERDGAGAARRLLAWGPGADDPIALFEAGRARFLHHDEQSSILAITDERGAVVERYRYDEFGRFLGRADAEGGGMASPLGFQGRPLLAGGRVADFRARAYLPEWGRFLQRDPIGLNGGLNLYAFAANDPLLYVDRDGQFFTIVGALCGFAFGFGFTLGNMFSDLWHGTWRGWGSYASELAQFTAGGAMIGLAVDTWGIGNGIIASGLIGSGFESFSHAFGGGDWDGYFSDVARGFGTGVLLWGATKVVGTVLGPVINGLAKTPAGQAMVQVVERVVQTLGKTRAVQYAANAVKAVGGSLSESATGISDSLGNLPGAPGAVARDVTKGLELANRGPWRSTSNTLLQIRNKRSPYNVTNLFYDSAPRDTVTSRYWRANSLRPQWLRVLLTGKAAPVPGGAAAGRAAGNSLDHVIPQSWIRWTGGVRNGAWNLMEMPLELNTTFFNANTGRTMAKLMGLGGVTAASGVGGYEVGTSLFGDEKESP